MSRFVLALLLSMVCSRAVAASPDGALAVTLAMGHGGGRTAVVLYLVRQDRPLAWRAGLAILAPHRRPASYEAPLRLPGVPALARRLLRARNFWRSATIEPCAGTRFLLPRL